MTSCAVTVARRHISSAVDRILVLLERMCCFLRDCRPAASNTKDVVVVGASFGGLAVAQQLAGRRDLDVTVVDFKDYFEYTPGILRCFVNPGYLSQLTCPLQSRRHRYTHGEVTGASATSVSVRRQDGTVYELSFDYLVLACGSTYQEPIKPVPAEPTLGQREASWRVANNRLKLAETVIIVGGGAVGVELAGEILTEFPEKRVIIVTNTVLPGFPKKCSDYVLEWLRAMNVELRLGEGTTEINTDSVTLRSGEVLEAGIVYKCIGMQPNTSLLRDTLFQSTFGSRDAITVNDHLQLPGFSNVFCVGDMMSHTSRDLKLGHTAEVNGHLVAHNIEMMEDQGQLWTYPKGVTGADTTPKLFVVSLGRYHASLGFNWLLINGWLPAVVKWLLEWTKVAAAAGRPVGVAFWALADAVSMWMGRTLIRSS